MNTQEEFKGPWMDIPFSPKDWPEDFDQENGKYMCRCYKCGSSFIGYKRRVICKECNTVLEQREKWADEYPTLLAENKRLQMEVERLNGIANKLKELQKYHIAPYNLGDEGEVQKLIINL